MAPPLLLYRRVVMGSFNCEMARVDINYTGRVMLLRNCAHCVGNEECSMTGSVCHCDAPHPEMQRFGQGIPCGERQEWYGMTGKDLGIEVQQKRAVEGSGRGCDEMKGWN